MESSQATDNAAQVSTPAFGRKARLSILAELAAAAGVDPLAREARALAKRVAEERFFVACVGQFKRGKSTLLNALVETSVLPTGVIPVTAIVTVLRHGQTSRAEVHFQNGAHQEVSLGSVVDYVSEERNSNNRKGISAVEVFLPSPLLAAGMCLVDTPGIGSVFQGNTAVTREFVPHIDAALVVIGADPPISGEELALTEDVAKHVTDVFFVLNKADRLSEHDCDEAVAFAQRTLAERIGRTAVNIFRVSAYEWMNQQRSQPPSRDERLLREALEKLTRESGAKLVDAAEARGLRRLSIGLLRELDGFRSALLLPIENSRRLVDHLSATIADAERSLGDLNYLFKAEQERVSSKCAEQREKFLANGLPQAMREFHQAIGAPDQRGAVLRGKATALAQQISRQWLDRWLAEERPAAEKMYSQSAQRFIDLANEFLRRLAASGDSVLADLPNSVDTETGLTRESHLYYGEHFSFPRQTFSGWLLAMLRTRRKNFAIIERQVGRYLSTLLALNSTRILNDLDERVRDSARKLQAQIRSHLKQIAESARRTLDRAAHKQTEGAEAVRREVERIDALRRQVLDLLPDGVSSSNHISTDRAESAGDRNVAR